MSLTVSFLHVDNMADAAETYQGETKRWNFEKYCRAHTEQHQNFEKYCSSIRSWQI